MWNLTREEQTVLLFVAAVFLVGLGVKLTGGIPRLPKVLVSKESIEVKIEGAVKEPGWYDIPKGSLVIEGIREAGGALPQADLRGMNLGSSLEDKEEIWIPGEKLNINRASLEQLTYLPGIGPVLAQRIIEYRAKNGPFHNLSELTEIPGIGEVKFARIEEKITLDDEY
jgi:competence protein ComEA